MLFKTAISCISVSTSNPQTSSHTHVLHSFPLIFFPSFIVLYILWHPSVEIFRLGGFSLRWYSLCWLIGLLLAYLIVKHLYKEQKVKNELFEPVFIYCFFGVLIGARLGHCLFYEPDYFLSSPTRFIEMIVPARRMPDGSWLFTGYEGLSSHGGVIGILIAMVIYCKQTKLSFWFVLDNLGIACTVTGCFIRLGNLMNSEIIGKPVDLPWAFIFERVDMQPRHPGQLYEALAYLCIFIVVWLIHKKHLEKVGTGFFFGLCLVLVFTFRFFIEFVKDVQEAFEADMLINMGQILSIPFIIIGAYCMTRKKRKIFA